MRGDGAAPAPFASASPFPAAEEALLLLAANPRIGAVRLFLDAGDFAALVGRFAAILPSGESCFRMPAWTKPGDLLPRSDALEKLLGRDRRPRSPLEGPRFVALAHDEIVDPATRASLFLAAGAREVDPGGDPRPVRFALVVNRATADEPPPLFPGLSIARISSSPSAASVRRALDGEDAVLFAATLDRLRAAIVTARRGLGRCRVGEDVLEYAASLPPHRSLGGGNDDLVRLVEAARARAALSGHDAIRASDVDHVLALLDPDYPSQESAEHADPRPAGSSADADPRPPAATPGRRPPAPDPREPEAPDAAPAPPVDLDRWVRSSFGRSPGRARRAEHVRGRASRTRRRERPGERVSALATLLAAAPYQRARGWTPGRPLVLERSDLMTQVREAKVGVLFVVIIDASGSMARSRIRKAKGAALSLLAEAYVHRDRVGIVAFSGRTARTLLYPGQSLALGRRALRALPTGDTTPLSRGLVLALALFRSSRRGERGLALLFTDGRANVASGEGGDPRAEARSVALAMAREGLDLVVVDRAPGGAESLGLARALGAAHVVLSGDPR